MCYLGMSMLKKDITDKDNLGDHWPIHDPTIKWKLMTPVLDEKYESPEQLKRALAFYALANGYKKKYTRVQYRNLFWKAKATYPTRFEKVMKHIQSITKEAYKHLMDRQLESWNKAYFTTNKACDFVENENSECFNALIVDARRKPIINMLEDIRVLCMERLQKMREKHEKHWNVIPSGESRFEVRNGCEGFKNMSGWYNKDIFVNAYNHYIEGMNRMDQWLSTDYQKHLPPIKRRMHGRPPHKRKRDVIEDYGNRTMIMSATCEIVSASVGKVTTTCEIVCACDGNMSASGEIVSTRGGNVFARGGKVSARGGKVFARGGIVTVSGGNVTEKGGKVTAIGGKVTTRGGKVFVRGRKVCARGGKVSTTSSTPSKSPCTSHPRFKMSILDTTSSDVRLSGGIRMRGGGAIKLREGVWIRSHKKERSSNADVDSISSSMNKLRIINGKVVTSRGRGDGSKSRMYPGGIRTIGFGVSWDSIDGHTMLGQQPVPRQQQPVIRRTSERIAQIMFNKPLSHRPGLDPDDANSIE
ncbi:hypothetical protein Tco_0677516 [Tanacetum coccineum]|uniref:Uncharacterized protein n=1 Tax=Tanacetum coccineum TaxID=301880 RepID=A0ABQ4XDR7_9ASTR